MAKVKSTIDLIMEKTKHMSLSDEEKKVLKRRDLEDSVKILAFRFIKEEHDDEFLVNELRQLSKEEAHEARKICLNVLVREFSPLDENPRVCQGIQKIIGDGLEETVQKATEDVRNEYKRKEEDLRKEATTQCYRELESDGIRGSALIPRIEAASLWQVESKKLIESSRTSLQRRLEGLLQR